MKITGTPALQLEHLLEKLLRYGTLLASAVTALGLALFSVSRSYGLSIATAGVALYILLPITRVAAMLMFFLKVKDYRCGAFAALVISMIFLGTLLGSR
jgi:uncharacterized membrane protein